MVRTEQLLNENPDRLPGRSVVATSAGNRDVEGRRRAEWAHNQSLRMLNQAFLRHVDRRRRLFGVMIVCAGENRCVGCIV